VSPSINSSFLLEGIFSQYVNRTMGYNNLSPSGRLRGSLICLSQALV